MAASVSGKLWFFVFICLSSFQGGSFLWPLLSDWSKMSNFQFVQLFPRLLWGQKWQLLNSSYVRLAAVGFLLIFEALYNDIIPIFKKYLLGQSLKEQKKGSAKWRACVSCIVREGTWLLDLELRLRWCLFFWWELNGYPNLWPMIRSQPPNLLLPLSSPGTSFEVLMTL